MAQHLGFPDGTFDVAICTLAVHHIPEAGRPATFAEMYRIIRPGGRVLVADFRAFPHASGRDAAHAP